MTLTAKHVECAQVCARLEISGQNTKKMARECGVERSNNINWLKSETVSGRESPLPKRFSAWTCPIFRSRTAGIASRSSPGLRTSVRPVRIAPRGVRYRCCQQLISIPIKNGSKRRIPSPPVAKGLYPASEKGLYWDAPRGTMRLTEKHIECAHLCARLEDLGPEHEKNGPRNAGGFVSNNI